MIDEGAGGVGDEVSNGSETGERGAGGFGERPGGGVDDVNAHDAVGRDEDGGVNEMLAGADENFLGKNS